MTLTDIQYNTKQFDVLSQLLKKQHYGTKTRLCDLTINPLVALYFSIEDETSDATEGSVYVYNKSKAISCDSTESRLLLLLATTQIATLRELQSHYEELVEKINRDSLESIITKNYIIDYNYNFAYTNTRSYLQGGTGILYGFGVSEGTITRKGKLDVDSLIAKIFIPANFKQIIRNYLKKYGICKEVLYDDVHSCKSLSYTIKEEHKNSITVKKIFLNISVSDVMFEERDIQRIIDVIYSKYKNPSYLNIMIFGWVFYDEQDKRNYNWIAMPQLKQGVFELRYNANYHKRRMDFMNREISIDRIVSRTEPIVEKCRQVQNYAVKLLKEYITQSLSVNDYQNEIKRNRSNLYKLIYFDLQDIEHGAKQYDDYYNLSNQYCIHVDEMLEHQEQLDTFEQLNRKMISDTHKCDDLFDNYEKSKELNDLFK